MDHHPWILLQKLVLCDVAYEYAGSYYCIFCEEKQYRDKTRYMTYPIEEEGRRQEEAYKRELIRDFPHALECIVLKARRALQGY